MKILVTAVLSVVAILFYATAAIPSPAYHFDSAPDSTDTQLSLGFEFTTTQQVEVAALGYWDFQQDGFATPHEIGIFDDLGSLIASTAVSVGASDPLIDQFRYASIVPIILGANRTYTIAATTHGGSDPWAYGNGYGMSPAMIGFAVASGIIIDTNGARFLYQNDDVLREPDSHFSNYTVYAGPNFLIADSVPEPQALGLLGIAILCLAALHALHGRHARRISLFIVR